MRHGRHELRPVPRKFSVVESQRCAPDGRNVIPRFLIIASMAVMGTICLTAQGEGVVDQFGEIPEWNRWTFFSPGGQGPPGRPRADYVRHSAANNSEPTAPDANLTKDSDEKEELEALRLLREASAQLNQIQRNHGTTRAAEIARHLLEEAAGIRVAPGDEFLPTDRYDADARP